MSRPRTLKYKKSLADIKRVIVSKVNVSRSAISQALMRTFLIVKSKIALCAERKEPQFARKNMIELSPSQIHHRCIHHRLIRVIFDNAKEPDIFVETGTHKNLPIRYSDYETIRLPNLHIIIRFL